MTGVLGTTAMNDIYQCLVEAPDVVEHAIQIGDRLCDTGQFVDGLDLVNFAIESVKQQSGKWDPAPLLMLRGRLNAMNGEVRCSAANLQPLLTAGLCSMSRQWLTIPWLYSYNPTCVSHTYTGR